jgi:hypothetical protein
VASTVTPAALEVAVRMGLRRGELFHDTGIPSPNPFIDPRLADLAAAWRAGYLAAVRPRKIGLLR